ncbi:hypothetical protein NQZ68_014803 [Dissostichus eleginoides]|nr:hypothetical protein NQZ68_014803 [Dissostichus eleginoides]
MAHGTEPVQCGCCCPSRLVRKLPVEHRRRPAGAEESRAEVQKQRETIEKSNPLSYNTVPRCLRLTEKQCQGLASEVWRGRGWMIMRPKASVDTQLHLEHL